MKNLLSSTNAFFLGAMTGATIALLNAPQSGKKTRAQLRGGVKNARARAEEAIEVAQTRVGNKVEGLQNWVEHRAYAIGAIGEETQHSVEKIKNLGHEVLEEQRAREDQNTSHKAKAAASR